MILLASVVFDVSLRGVTNGEPVGADGENEWTVTVDQFIQKNDGSERGDKLVSAAENHGRSGIAEAIDGGDSHGITQRQHDAVAIGWGDANGSPLFALA